MIYRCRETIDSIDDELALSQSSHRSHLGASILGHKCSRYLWLKFRWAVSENFSGRMLRLFRFGQDYEEIVVKDLKAMGVNILTQENGQQLRATFPETVHLSGSLDGLILDGLLESSEAHVLEIKTHNAKSFRRLVEKGVRASKPMHFAQCQVYMHATGNIWTYYIAENKDTSERYTERIKYSKKVATDLVNKGFGIIFREDMPDRMPYGPGCFECTYCTSSNYCWDQSTQCQEVNCRTCASFKVRTDNFTCKRHKRELSIGEQQMACESHIFIPSLIKAHLSGKDSGGYVYSVRGQEMINGPGGLVGEDFINELHA